MDGEVLWIWLDGYLVLGIEPAAFDYGSLSFPKGYFRRIEVLDPGMIGLLSESFQVLNLTYHKKEDN